MKTTSFLTEELKDAGLSLVVEPTLNMIAFRENSNSRLLAQKLCKLGWFVSYVPRYDCIRIVVMPHMKKKYVLRFLIDVTKCLNQS